MFIHYDATCGLSQHTLRILLMVFDVQPLQKHEAAKLLQPTGHLTQQPVIPASVLLPGSPHTILPRDSQLQYDHLSECFRQQNDVSCTASCRAGLEKLSCSVTVCVCRSKGHILSRSKNIQRRCDSSQCLLRFRSSTRAHTCTHNFRYQVIALLKRPWPPLVYHHYREVLIVLLGSQPANMSLSELFSSSFKSLLMVFGSTKPGPPAVFSSSDQEKYCH